MSRAGPRRHVLLDQDGRVLHVQGRAHTLDQAIEAARRAGLQVQPDPDDDEQDEDLDPRGGEDRLRSANHERNVESAASAAREAAP